MSAKNLTTTIGTLGDYSAGVSPIDYMRQCAQRNYISNWVDLNALYRQPIRQAGGGILFGWRHEVSGDEFGHFVSVRNPETSPVTQDLVALQYRIACHYLVDLVADEGLPELLDCLKENLEFYKTHGDSERPQLVSSSGLRVKLGKTYDRPTFQMAQE